MKKLTLAIWVMLIFTVGVAAEGFRDMPWGSSREEVIEAEGEPAYGEGDTIGYVGEIMHRSAFILFSFYDGGLVGGAYSINEDYANDNTYIDDYHEFKVAITDKYGPWDESSEKIASLYEDDKDEWGFAISAGYGEYQTRWENDTTGIVLMLHGESYDIKLTINYYDVQRFTSWRQRQEKESTKGL